MNIARSARPSGVCAQVPTGASPCARAYLSRPPSSFLGTKLLSAARLSPASLRGAEAQAGRGGGQVRCEANKPRRGKVKVERTGGNFRYFYMHGWRSGPYSMKAQYFKDVLGTFGIDLEVLDLNEGGTLSGYSVSGAVAALAQRVAETSAAGDTRPVRLIGSSAGAYACTLYAASSPVDRMFLLAPAFDFARVLEGAAGYEGLMDWQADGTLEIDGAQVPYSVLEDAMAQPQYPFVTAPSYVVQGHRDDVCRMETSLSWVRMASVNMRGVGDSGEEAGERRLLEVDDDHSLISSIKFIEGKMLLWFDFQGITDDLYPQPSEDVIQAIEVARKEEVQAITTDVPEFFERMKKVQEAQAQEIEERRKRDEEEGGKGGE